MQKNVYFPMLFAVLGFSFVIMFHECGHFIAAKLCGLNVPVFSLGFGPALFKIFFYNTTFQIALIPLGGYVSFDPILFSLLPFLKQTIIIFAGIFANIILAFALILFCYEDEKKHFFATFWYVIRNLQALTAKVLLKGNEEKILVGPFGIMRGMSQSYKENLCVYFLSIALLSLNVALFNILPLPLLDGGKFVQITIDAIFGPQPALVIFLISLFLLYILITVVGNLQTKKAQ